MVNSDTFVARDTDPDPTPDDIGPSIELLIHIDDICTYIDESNKKKFIYTNQFTLKAVAHKLHGVGESD